MSGKHIKSKGGKMLNHLEDLKLISLSKASDDPFLKAVRRLGKKAAEAPPSLEEITKEVEIVSSNRYAGKSKA